MKNLIKNLFLLSVASLILSSPAWAAADPLDLAVMKKAGLSQDSLSRFLAQNLDQNRLAAPLEADFLVSLANYGGDDLASAYLSFAEKNARLNQSLLTQQMIEELIKSDLGADNVKSVLANESNKLEKIASYPTAHETSPNPAMINENGPTRVPAPPAVEKPLAALDPPAPAPEGPAVPAGPRTPGYHHDMYYSLAPGQAADPAQLLPPEIQVAPIRSQAGPGPWMGVKERQMPDNHRYEANVSGDASLLGQEVLLRPTGKQIYRYHVGRPDSPQSGVAPR